MDQTPIEEIYVQINLQRDSLVIDWAPKRFTFGANWGGQYLMQHYYILRELDV